MKDKIYFTGEIPISLDNKEAYEKLFIVENWFRRILYTSLMAKLGKQWIDVFKDDENFEKYISIQNNGVKYSDEIKNLIWALDFSKLGKYINNEQVNVVIKEITNRNPKEMKKIIEKMIEIRNLIAHNRSISEEVMNRLEELNLEANQIIFDFKRNFIYYTDQRSVAEKILLENDDIVGSYYLKKMISELSDNSQVFFQIVSPYYYRLTSLPCLSLKLNQSYIDIELITKEFGSILDNILGIFINMSGDEYSIIFPKHDSYGFNDYKEIVDMFLRIECDIWTNESYEQQSPKYVCNPKIWFYKNRFEDY